MEWMPITAFAAFLLRLSFPHLPRLLNLKDREKNDKTVLCQHRVLRSQQ